jgi:hypothetical protein
MSPESVLLCQQSVSDKQFNQERRKMTIFKTHTVRCRSAGEDQTCSRKHRLTHRYDTISLSSVITRKLQFFSGVPDSLSTKSGLKKRRLSQEPSHGWMNPQSPTFTKSRHKIKIHILLAALFFPQVHTFSLYLI